MRAFLSTFLIGALSLLSVGIHEAFAEAIIDPAAVASACVITRQQAEATALHAVGSGKVVLAVCERNDSRIHWSVDIRGNAKEYEVWVDTKDVVIKIITQPL